MSRIVVLATGGTIASRSAGSGSVATDDAGALLGRLALPAGIEVEARDILRKNSFALTFADQRAVVEAVRDALADPSVDGVVVTHGTDTLEETAFLVDLAHDDPRPVVFTGAQLPADSPDTDGPSNIAEAVVTAAAPASRDRGVLVSFAGVLLAARGVRKERSVAMQPFGAPGLGPIGTVAGGAIDYAADPRPRVTLPSPDARFDRIRVDVVAAYPGADDALLRAAAAAGAHGIVIVGTGAGNTTPPMVPAIRDLVGAGVLVALGARADDGPVAAKYGGGGGADAVEAGAIPLGTLSVPQGRMLAALLLAQHPVDEAGRRLAEHALGAHPAQFPATEGHPS